MWIASTASTSSATRSVSSDRAYGPSTTRTRAPGDCRSSSRRKKGRQALPGRIGERRHRQPRRLTGTRAEKAGAAAVREDRDAASCRQRLTIERGREVEHLVQRVGADDARLAEERVDCRSSATGAAVPDPSSRLAGLRPGFTTTIGFPRLTPRATRANRRGFPNDSR